MDAYVTPATRDRVVIPFHACAVTCSAPFLDAPVAMRDLHLAPPVRSQGRMLDRTEEVRSLTVGGTDHEVVLDGPGVVKVKARLKIELVALSLGDAVLVELRLHAAHADAPVVSRIPLAPARDGSAGTYRWAVA